MSALSLKLAAKALKRTPTTLLSWIKQGAPCLREGEVGRGRGTLVDLEAVLRWRAAKVAPQLTQQSQQHQLAQLAQSLMRVFRNDQAAASGRMTTRQAAGLLVLTYERLHKDLTGQPVRVADLPQEIKDLLSISVQ